VSNADADEVIDYLYTHRFLDEARFSRAYARDKARFAKWGRNKIIINLKAKQISSENIRYALQEIPQEEYMDILLATTRTLARGLNLAAYTDRAKLYRKLATRGYTASEISQALARLQADS
jgi:regulatory protein